MCLVHAKLHCVIVRHMDCTLVMTVATMVKNVIYIRLHRLHETIAKSVFNSRILISFKLC